MPKTAELVAAHIRRRIVRGELKEGDALPPETALMEEFAISRPTLREAFRILESEGLITVRRGARGGARVQVPTSDVAARYAGLVLQHRGTTLADVLEARVIVEAPAAGIVAGRRGPRQGGGRRCGSGSRSTRRRSADFHGFNRLLVQLTGERDADPADDDARGDLRCGDRQLPEGGPRGRRRLARKAERTRLKLIELIEEGDEAGAEELWRKHLTEAGKVARWAPNEHDAR